MRKLLFGAFLLLLLFGVVTPAGAIVFGGPDGTNHPNVGLLSVHVNGAKIPFCSGILVAPQVFLTAGHCTDELTSFGIQPAQVKVSFDKDNALVNGLLDVTALVSHPDYDGKGESNPFDVGALILAQPAGGITPASLPAPGFLEDLQSQGKLHDGTDKTKFTVVGYGVSLELSPPQQVPADGQRRVAESGYKSLTKALLKLSQNNGGGGTCVGDSGGPVFYQDGNQEVFVGTSSGGDPNCVAFGTYYRADISETQDFVDGIIADLE